MAIKSIDANAGVELVSSKALAAISRRSRPPAAAPAPNDRVAAAGSVQDAEKTKAEQTKVNDSEAEKAGVPASETLRFSVDKDTGKTVAELVDHEGQVLRQMPTEEALQVAKAIGRFQGMFVNLKV
jgi:flagellar protein FlaG